MAYENDGNMGYLLTRTYEDGLMVPIGSKIYGDREQTQALAACLQAKASAEGNAWRYGVAGIVPIGDVPIPANYAGPHHDLNDACKPENV
jgi:hypothetical protein